MRTLLTQAGKFQILLLSLVLMSFHGISQITFTIHVSNNSKNTISFRLPNNNSVHINPKEEIALKDTLADIQIASLNCEAILHQNGENIITNISFIVLNESLVRIELFNTNDLKKHLAYKISGLAYEPDISEGLHDYINKKNSFLKTRSKHYVNRYDYALTPYQKDSITKILRSDRLLYFKFVEDFLLKIKDSQIAYYLFEIEFLNNKSILNLGKEKVISVFEKLNPRWLNLEIGIRTKEFVRNLKLNMVGSKIQDFQFKTHDFKTYRLHKLIDESEYLLLIFTAKWCGACIKQIPEVRALFNRLKPNLQVVYISLDRSLQQWEEGLKSDYPGLQTLNMPPYNFSLDLRNFFMVDFIPQVFLVKKNYEILYDNMSPYEDDDTLDRLKDILNVN